MCKIEYQLRSEETGLHYTDSHVKAIAMALDDPTIWKISWTDREGVRQRIIRSDNEWIDAPMLEAILCARDKGHSGRCWSIQFVAKRSDNPCGKVLDFQGRDE